MTYSLPMILKAIASNQIARFAPGLYMKLKGLPYRNTCNHA